MFILGFFSVLYDYCIYAVLVVCVNIGTVMSKGKMPAVEARAYISHSQNHNEKILLVRCYIFPFYSCRSSPVVESLPRAGEPQDQLPAVLTNCC